VHTFIQINSSLFLLNIEANFGISVHRLVLDALQKASASDNCPAAMVTLGECHWFGFGGAVESRSKASELFGTYFSSHFLLIIQRGCVVQLDYIDVQQR
jgi:hypothetical protein